MLWGFLLGLPVYMKFGGPTIRINQLHPIFIIPHPTSFNILPAD